jgi:uncharacterized protein YndB with AHSA1/START domain
MKSLKIKVVLTVKAPCNDVFDAITNSKKIVAWSGQKAKVQLSICGKFEMFDGWVKGVVLSFIPNTLLVFTWKPSDWSDDALPSIVTFNFSEVKGITRITLTHTGFPNPHEAQSHKDGWVQFVFEPLKLYLFKK